MSDLITTEHLSEFPILEVLGFFDRAQSGTERQKVTKQYRDSDIVFPSCAIDEVIEHPDWDYFCDGFNWLLGPDEENWVYYSPNKHFIHQRTVDGKSMIQLHVKNYVDVYELYPDWSKRRGGIIHPGDYRFVLPPDESGVHFIVAP